MLHDETFLNTSFSFKVGYYLVEERGWALDLAELERSYQAAKV